MALQKHFVIVFNEITDSSIKKNSKKTYCYTIDNVLNSSAGIFLGPINLKSSQGVLLTEKSQTHATIKSKFLSVLNLI